MKTINKKKVGYIELDAITPDPLLDNQVWTDGDDLFVRLDGVTKKLNDQSGGGMEIGEEVTGGTPDSILYVDENGDLGEDDKFTRGADGTTNIAMELSNGDTVAYKTGEIEPFPSITLDGIGMEYQNTDTTTIFGIVDATSLGGAKGLFAANSISSNGTTNILMHPDIGFQSQSEDSDLQGMRLQNQPEFGGFVYQDDVDSPTVTHEFNLTPTGQRYSDGTDEYFLPTNFPVADAYIKGNADGTSEWTTEFKINLNFIDETVATIKAPKDMKIMSITAESGTPTIEVNGVAYTLEDDIDQFDEIEVTATVDTLVILNCQ
jgi:hypothetical protein